MAASSHRDVVSRRIPFLDFRAILTRNLFANSHHSSPSWLPSPRINYKIFMNALDVYGGAEMRLGR